MIAYKYACPHNANIHRVIDKRLLMYVHITPHEEKQTGVTLSMTRICNSLTTRHGPLVIIKRIARHVGVTASSRIPRRPVDGIFGEFQGECQTRLHTSRLATK